MQSTVVAFSGGIASGKSTLSEAVARSVGCARVSFGHFMRNEARRLGRAADREALQNLGQELVERDPEDLCRRVLSQAGLLLPGTSLVVDGVRHVVIVDALRRIVTPSPVKLVHVSLDTEARAQRLRGRGESASRLRQYEMHPTEGDVASSLPRIADLVVDGARPIEELIDRVVGWATKLP